MGGQYWIGPRSYRNKRKQTGKCEQRKGIIKPKTYEAVQWWEKKIIYREDEEKTYKKNEEDEDEEEK